VKENRAVPFEPWTLFGLLAGVAGIADLIGIYARRNKLSETMVHVRMVGAFLMLGLSFLVLSGWVKFGSA
jgi:hypothetical protein